MACYLGELFLVSDRGRFLDRERLMLSVLLERCSVGWVSEELRRLVLK